MKVGNHSNSL